MNRYVIVVEAGPVADRGVESVHGVDGGGYTGDDVTKALAEITRGLANAGLVNPRATIVKLTDTPTRAFGTGTVAFGGRSYPATRRANGEVRYEWSPGHTVLAPPAVRDTYRTRDAK
jgi:hypothetical protein